MSTRIRSLLRPGMVMAALLLTAQRCPGNEGPSDYGARVRMNHVREAIVAFERNQRRLPRDLTELCTDADACGYMLPGGAIDPWGSPILYTLMGDEYELQSPGRDRAANTQDDVTFRPSVERKQVAQYAGCYKIHFPEWDEFPGRQILLDSVPVGTGVYPLLPTVSGRQGYWFPLRDSIWLAWAHTPSITRVVLGPQGGKLAGYWRVSGEYSESRRRGVQAERVACGR